MKKKFDKSFCYAICFFIVFFLLCSFFAWTSGGNDQENELPGEGLQQQKRNGEEKEKNEEGLQALEYNEEGEGYYLGIHAGQIAVYRQASPGELVLKEVLPYPVKDVYRQELQKGVPFLTEEEKLLLLENYTS